MIRWVRLVLAGVVAGAACAEVSTPADGAPPVLDAAADLAVDAVDVGPDLPARNDLPPSSGLFVDRAEVDFGVFHLGCPRASAMITVVNWSPGDAGPLLATLDPPFRLGADGCSAGLLAPGQACSVEVQVSPEEPGDLAGALQIFAGSELVKVRLKVRVADLVPSFLLTPDTLDFGAQPVGQAATRRVTLSVPAGSRPIPRMMAAITGAAFELGAAGCLMAGLEGGQSCEVEVAFRPAAAGPRTGALTLSAPAPCPPFQSQVLLQGTGR
jgi:hypothetical protein